MHWCIDEGSMILGLEDGVSRPRARNEGIAVNHTTAYYQKLHNSKKMDEQGIEPWTTHMLSEYYTTKPFAQ
ncbi:hypothetical protein CGLO_09987 [Colletotrichum gloeosporioides Cg-14]|uniref:Uncharacterized protein n=1 Tax=Colletotrichum gloeosporioides (strain Cg-14) TaxID=1237896 RepID=T0K536_COLGC|nr:hypothetical protein CGLO_09987 [Colletotrichum gloeosporioides Cg-14]